MPQKSFSILFWQGPRAARHDVQPHSLRRTAASLQGTVRGSTQPRIMTLTLRGAAAESEEHLARVTSTAINEAEPANPKQFTDSGIGRRSRRSDPAGGFLPFFLDPIWKRRLCDSQQKSCFPGMDGSRSVLRLVRFSHRRYADRPPQLRRLFQNILHQKSLSNPARLFSLDWIFSCPAPAAFFTSFDVVVFGDFCTASASMELLRFFPELLD